MDCWEKREGVMSDLEKGTRGADEGDAHIGGRIRLRRTMLGMSQEKLGEALGLTFQQVQKYERGANRVSASRLQGVAEALDVPVGFFYDGMPGARKAFGVGSGVSGFAETQAQFGAPPAPVPAFGAADPAEAALFGKKETLELVRAYHRIPDAAVRRRVLDLVRSMGPVE